MEYFYDFLVDFNFNGDAGEAGILSINGISLPQDYIEFMKKYNGGEGSIGKGA